MKKEKILIINEDGKYEYLTEEEYLDMKWDEEIKQFRGRYF